MLIQMLDQTARGLGRVLLLWLDPGGLTLQTEVSFMANQSNDRALFLLSKHLVRGEMRDALRRLVRILGVGKHLDDRFKGFPSAIPASRPMVSRSISFRRLIESMPGDPTVKMREKVAIQQCRSREMPKRWVSTWRWEKSTDVE